MSIAANTLSTRTARQIPVTLPAGVPDAITGRINPQQITLTASGNKFYVISCSSPLSIQPQRAGSMGATNSYGVFQGSEVQTGFDTLIVSNPTAYPIVGIIWVGFDEFINNQLALVGTTFQNVAYPTYSAPNSAAVVNIPDLSGQPFYDINGKRWGAISRVCIEVFNLDTGVTMLLQKYGSAISNGAAVGACYPVTPIRFDFGGNYTLNIGGGNINAVVNEIYQAIPL